MCQATALPRGSGVEPPAATPDLRVLVAIAGLLALLAGAIFLAVFLIVGLSDDATQVTDRQGRYVRSIHEAAVNAKGVANDQRGFLLTGRRVYLRELAGRNVKAQAAFRVARDTATSEGEILAVEEASTGYDRWWKELQADIATFQAGQRRPAIERSMGPTRELRKDYEHALDLAYVLGVSALESEKTSVAEDASRSVMFLLGYLVFALVVGAAIAVWIIRTILEPAYGLLHMLDEDARATPRPVRG